MTDQATTQLTTTLVDTNSKFQHIQICQHEQYGQQLILDNDLQISSCDIAYQVAMTSPLIGRLPKQSHVAILGGGDGGVLNQLLIHHDLGHINLASAKLIDIDEQVVELCKKHLPNLSDKIDNHPIAEVMIDDAFAFLKQQNESLDAIIYDLTMIPINSNQTQSTFTKELLESIHQALKPKGVLSMQVCGLKEIDPTLKQQSQVLQEIVPQYAKPLFDNYDYQHALIPSFEMQWLFINGQKRVTVKR